jgi:hypothetical protein
MCKRHVTVYLEVMLQVITSEPGLVIGRVHKDGVLGGCVVGDQAYYVTNSFELVDMDNQI